MTDVGAQWVAAMRAGRHAEAWAISDRALRARDPATRDDPRCDYHQRWVWDGRAFYGRDVLVRCYHGLGDTLQFARFLPLLAARAASVTVEAQPRLCTLLRSAFPAIRVVPFALDRPLPPAECDIGITELPHALRAEPADAPAAYLRVVPPSGAPARVGICNTSGAWDPARNVPAALLSPLCARVRCVTLVAGDSPLPVVNPAGCPFDMDATAALVAALDLVVTVDTMIAHLAGALGRPTWLLLRNEPDWRWTPGARTTPWYPSMRLYHQPAPGDWASVVAAVAADLDAQPLATLVHAHD